MPALKPTDKFLPALVFAVLGLVALVYWPGLAGGFTFDDYPNIVDNPTLRVTGLAWADWVSAALSSPASALQRPLAMLSFAANHYFSGLDPWPMKLTNVAIHLLNTVLAFMVARRLLSAMPASPHESPPSATDRTALLIAALWALNPINLMAVLFIVQRMESLSHTFVFLGLLLYLRGRLQQLQGKSGWSQIVGGLLPCTFLGLLSKESAVLLPLYAFVLELLIFRFNGSNGQRDHRIISLFVVVLLIPALAAVSWLLPRSMEPGAFANRNFTLYERLLTEPRVVLDYFRWTLLPNLGEMSLSHDDYQPSRGLFNPISTLAGLIGVLALLAVSWVCRYRRPLVALGLLWFLGAQLLTATFLNLELVFEHRNYFASFGLSIVLVDLLVLAPKAMRSRQLGLLVAGLFVLFFSAMTYLRAQEWSDPVRFASTEAAKKPASARATYEFARILIVATNYNPDSQFTDDAWLALDRARNVPRSGILPNQAALMFAARTGRPLEAEWWKQMRDRLANEPIGPQEQLALIALANCAAAGSCKFPKQEMMGLFAAGLSRRSDPGVLSTYGDYAWRVLGDRELALRLWLQASEIDPRNARHRLNLSLLLMEMNRMDEAAAQISLLHNTGRLGQYSSVAESLRARMRNAKQEIE